jgi:phosphate butyryltransferase
MVISGFPALKDRLRDLPPKTAVVAAAHDEHTLQAVFAARRDGLIRPILVGHKEEILSAARRLGEEPDPSLVVDAGEDPDCAVKSVALIRSGEGDMLIKGMLPTGTLLKAVVNKATGIRASEVMSHVAILDVPSYHKLLYVTDGGMVVAPDLEQKRHILRNALDFCRFLGYDCPKAAALCAVETVSPAMPETADAAALKTEGERGDFGPCLVEGPIALDLATDPEAARVKGYHSPVAGDADILLAPSIAAGNLLGKSLYGLAGGEMAGVVLGAKAPITVNSRGATAEEKYWSILICAAMK